MKRLLLLTVAFLLLLTCGSCGEDTLVRVTYWGDYNGEYEKVRLSEEKQSELLAFLEGLDKENWEDGDNNCAKDYKFETKTRHWEYHASCGSLSDYPGDRCISLTQEQADTLHDLLGIPRITVRDRS